MEGALFPFVLAVARLNDRPVSGIWPTACFYKYILLEHSHAHSFTYFSMGAFEQSLKVAAESIWSTKPELCGILTKMAF